jgi:hypothetical protein
VPLSVQGSQCKVHEHCGGESFAVWRTEELDPCPFVIVESSIPIAVNGDASGGIPLAVEAALSGRSVVIPLCESIHFQCLMLHGPLKKVYLFDSLCKSVGRMERLKRGISGLIPCGWTAVEAPFDMQNGDLGGPWSCGLWVEFAALQFTLYCEMMQNHRSYQRMVEPAFNQWIEMQVFMYGLGTKYTNGIYACLMNKDFNGILNHWVAGRQCPISAPPGFPAKCSTGKFGKFADGKSAAKRQKVNASIQDSTAILVDAGIRFDEHEGNACASLGESLLRAKLKLPMRDARRIMKEFMASNIAKSEKAQGCEVCFTPEDAEVAACTGDSTKHRSKISVQMYLSGRYPGVLLTDLHDAILELSQRATATKDLKETLFAEAKSTLHVDFFLKPVEFWVKEIVRLVDGKLEAEWVRRKLFHEHRQMLKDAGVPLDIGDDSDTGNDSEEEEKCDPVKKGREQCMQAFKVWKAEGPTTVCDT